MVGVTRIELVIPTMSSGKYVYLMSIIFIYLLSINGLILQKIFTFCFYKHKLDFIDLQLTILAIYYLKNDNRGEFEVPKINKTFINKVHFDGKGALLELQRAKELFHDESGKNYVFPFRLRKRKRLDDVALYMQKLCAANEGFGKYTLHQFRHTFATTAAEMCYADTTIAGLLGHAQRGVTSHYIHAVDKALIVAADDVGMKIRE